MKKAKIIAIVFAIVAIGLVLTIFLHPRSAHMAVYQGKTAQQWIDEIGTTNYPAAFLALHAIGSNALPVLVENLRGHDSRWNRFYCSNYPKLPATLRNHLPRPLPMSWTWGHASLALEYCPDGEMCCPQLLAMLTDKNNDARPYILGSLQCWAGPKHADWTPIMLQCFSETDLAMRVQSAAILGKIGPKANCAVPVLKAALKDRNEFVRIEAAFALWHIARETNGIAVVKNVLDDSKDSDARRRAAEYLLEMDPSDLSTLPVFIRALYSSDAGVVVWALTNLQQYGPAAKSAVTALVSGYKASPWLKTNFFEALSRIDPETAERFKTE